MAFYQNFLEQHTIAGVRLGLERMEQLMVRLDNPQFKIPCVHIAGTNGKGSTCAFIYAMVQAAGYRVGCYTSPHLVDWRERISVQGRPITPEELDRILHTIAPYIDQVPGISQFEVLTAAALVYFAEQKLDLMVLEVGLGGRLDATNVVQPLVTAITSIGMDHGHILGPTLSAIAGEKAGIIKPKVPVVTGILPFEAQSVISQRAAQLGSVCTVVPAALQKNGSYYSHGLVYQTALQGAIQAQNSAVALEVCHSLEQQGWVLPHKEVGLAQARWAGRYEKMIYQGRSILIDGAHNPDGAKQLRAFVDAWQTPVSWIVGILQRKDAPEILQHLLRPGDYFYPVPVLQGPSYDPVALADLAQTIQPQLALCYPCSDPAQALTLASDPVVICGSLYLIGDFLATQGYTPETLA